MANSTGKYARGLRLRPISIEALPAPPASLPSREAALVGQLREVLGELETWSAVSGDAGSDLYELPPTAFGGEGGENPSATKSEQLFLLPDSHDELHELAFDPATGERRLLNAEQSAALRRTGQFAVPSALFTGASHVWEINAFVLRGTATLWNDLLNALAGCAGWLVNDGPMRLCYRRGHLFNLPDRWLELPSYLRKIADLIVGTPRTKPIDDTSAVRRALNLERKRQVLAAHEPSLWAARRQGGELDKYPEPPPPSTFALESGFNEHFPDKYTGLSPLALALRPDAAGPPTLDLTLESSQVVFKGANSLHSAVNQVLQKVAEAWRHDKHVFAQEVASALGGGLDEAKVPAHDEELSEVLHAEHARRARAALEELGEQRGIQGLPERFDLVSIVRAVERTEHDIVEAKREAIKLAVETEYPFLSRNERWKQQTILDRFDAWKTAEKFGRSDVIARATLDACRAAGLATATLCLERDLEARQTLPSLAQVRNKLEATRRLPEATIRFCRPIILPRNWIVKKDPVTSVYSAERETIHMVTSACCGWRFALLYQNWMWIFKAGIAMLSYSLWSGPLSLQALFRCAAFPENYELDPHTGEVVPTKSRTETLASRLTSVWESVFESRRRFEAEPDVGLISKRLTRLLNVAWSYGVTGFCGTLLVVAGQPVLTALNLGLSSALLAGWIAIAPALAVVSYVTDMVLYDRYTFGFPACLPLAALTTVMAGEALLGAMGGVLAVVEPALAVVGGTISVVVWLLASAKDGLVWCLFIGGEPKIPAGDTFIARRVAGPGLATQVYYQISAEAAATLVQVELERRILELFQLAAEHELDEPARRMALLESGTLNFGGAGLSPSARILVTADVGKFKTKLRTQCERRRKELPKESNSHHAVRLSQAAIENLLDFTKRAVAEALPKFIELHWDATAGHHRTPASPVEAEAAFWDSVDLPVGAVDALARKVITDASHHDLLKPLEDADARVEIEVQHVTARRFIANLAKAKVAVDDLDKFKFKMADIDKPSRVPPLHVDDLLWATTWSSTGPEDIDPFHDTRAGATYLGGCWTLTMHEWRTLFDLTSPGLLIEIVDERKKREQAAYDRLVHSNVDLEP